MSELSIIQGPYLQDILGQPQALQDTLLGLDTSKPLNRLVTRLRRGSYQRIVLTGMGGSFHALYPATLELVDHGFNAIRVETSELVHYQDRFLDSRSLIIVVSQSGESAEVVRLLQRNRSRADLIAVTNSPDSTLARCADAVVRTLAGEEFSVACKTYVAGLMALKWLADVLCGKYLQRTRQKLAKAVSAARIHLSLWESHTRALMSKLESARLVFLVGRGRISCRSLRWRADCQGERASAGGRHEQRGLSARSIRDAGQEGVRVRFCWRFKDGGTKPKIAPRYPESRRFGGDG